MEVSHRTSRILFVGLWIAFIGFAGLYWYSVNSAISLVALIDDMNSRVVQMNSTIDELRYELHGPAGCVTLNDEMKKHQKNLQDGLPEKEKAITDKSAAATKAAESLKTIKEEHSKVEAEYALWTNKSETLNATCIMALQNITATCEAERNRTRSKPFKAPSFLGKIFGVQ